VEWSPAPRADFTAVVVGIGPGDPDLVTLQALEALGSVDVVVVFDKGERVDELLTVRRAVLDRASRGAPPRVLALPDPERELGGTYTAAVRSWHHARAAVLERVLLDHVPPGARFGLPVWGDPGLYDSTLRLLDALNDRGRLRLAVEVVPGVSSLQLLAARHGIVLHRVGGSLLVTSGRRLRAGIPPGVEDVAVFLDGSCSFVELRGAGWWMFWGAYLGMPGEVLVSGPLDEVADRIVELRTALRGERGWIFDLYLLRRHEAAEPELWNGSPSVDGARGRGQE
jgi:precorrin-6A synthase